MLLSLERIDRYYMSYRVYTTQAQLSLFDNKDNKNVLLLLPTPDRSKVHPRDRIFKKNVSYKKQRPTK